MLANTLAAKLLERLISTHQFSYQGYRAVFAGLVWHACVSE
jgi:hypothetical protein